MVVASQRPLTPCQMWSSETDVLNSVGVLKSPLFHWSLQLKNNDKAQLGNKWYHNVLPHARKKEARIIQNKINREKYIPVLYHVMLNENKMLRLCILHGGS